MAYGRWVIDDSNSRAEGPVGVLNRDLADKMAQMMRGVITRGTGRRLSAVQPAIAGKTGTAELQDAASHAWFAGFSPYAADAQKRIAFCVLVENGQYGGSTAAPLAGEIVTAARDLGIIR
jgi:peptidoglycan glycosyltransferase